MSLQKYRLIVITTIKLIDHLALQQLTAGNTAIPLGFAPPLSGMLCKGCKAERRISMVIQRSWAGVHRHSQPIGKFTNMQSSS
jgi:hypothetical protein